MDFARTVDEVVTAVVGYWRPCALKIVSPQVIHKSDVGGVKLNVVGATAAENAQAIIDAVTENVCGAVIDGIVVTPMADQASNSSSAPPTTRSSARWWHSAAVV